MPYGLPSATVCASGGNVAKFDLATYEPRGEESIYRGQHFLILHVGADQDGFEGEIICTSPDNPGVALAVPRSRLRLS